MNHDLYENSVAYGLLNRNRIRLQWVSMILFPIILFIVTLFLGRYQVAPSQVVRIIGKSLLDLNIQPDWSDSAQTVIMRVRLPRAVMALLIGAGLSMSGASFQGMFQNPLVSPFILGVSAGASFGAALGLVFELPAYGIQGLAFLFGILAVGIAYLIAHIFKTTPVLMLVLSGMVVSAFFRSMLSLLKFFLDDEEKLPAITFWLMGSLGSIGPDDMLIAGITMIIPMIMLFLLRHQLNVLSLGDNEARALGINNEKLRLLVIISTTIITSTAVAYCGIIGWVGQVIPHFCRMIVGPNHRRLIPATIFLGAGYLLLIDNLCRLLTPNEIPIGILTAFIGAPVFAYLLRKTRGGWN